MKASAVAVMIVLSWSLSDAAIAAGPFTITLDTDVGTGVSLNMGMGSGGMGGSIMTGGGSVEFQGRPLGTMMHSTMTATMSGMMGGQTLQQRSMSFELPGSGTIFAVMAGGNPWTGGKGIIMGGTDALQGISGTFTVGDQIGGAGSTRYHFNFTYNLP